MRILMISDVYFPRINGVSTSIQTFRRELAQLGHEVLLIAPQYGPQLEQDGLPIQRISARPVPGDPEDRLMSLRELKRLAAVLEPQRFDIMHIQTPFVAHYAGISLARTLRIPVVETYHTYFEEYLHHYVPFAPRAVMRYVARRFTLSQAHRVKKLVAPSHAMRDALLAYGVGTPVAVIPTGLQEDRFVPGDGEAFRRRLGIDRERPVVVHVGRIAHEKNVEFLLRMMVKVHADLPNALLLIAGEGPALRHCQHLAASLGLAGSTLFSGYLDRAGELLDCYSAGDLFAFASRTETQGLVLLEAMAQGIPVVSTAHMGTVDVLGSGRGCAVVQEDEAEFAAKVVELLRDNAARARLALDARTYAGTWSARSMAEKLVHLYRLVLGETAAGGLTSPRQHSSVQSRPGLDALEPRLADDPHSSGAIFR